MSVGIVCYVKATIVFYKYYDFFRRRHALMKQPSHSNFFQIKN